jgi:hypothetical protein
MEVPAWQITTVELLKTREKGDGFIWSDVQTALGQGLLTRNKRKRMPRRWILRQNFHMIKSSWTCFGNTLVVQRSILAVGLVDMPHGFLKGDLRRQYVLSIIVN